MDESYAIRRYEQAAALLPLRWQQQARQLAPGQMALAEELRLRAGRPMTVLLPEGEVVPGRSDLPPTVTQSDLEQLCDAVTDYSRYAAGETLSRGYLTARGGFRVGVCGTAVLRDGINTNLRDLSSVTIRIGREQPGLGDAVLPQLFRDGQFCSTVVLSPPGLGRVLRDTELTGDEERIVSALTSAACRLDRLADTRRRDRRQQERLLWTAALSGAGLFIILLM